MDYTPVLERWRSIEGMMLEPSAVVWCMLLEAQQSTWSWKGLKAGDYLEIGAYKGKSGSILAHYSSLYNNQSTFVDPIIRDDTKVILSTICQTTQYINTTSERLWLTPYHKQNIRNIAFAHIDGMHTYSAVSSDIRICEEMLDEYGILCIDDFYTDYTRKSLSRYMTIYARRGLILLYSCRVSTKRICVETRQELTTAISLQSA